MRDDFLSWFNVRSDWLDIVVGGSSPIDRLAGLEVMNHSAADSMIMNYGYHPADPIELAELYGYFREAVEFMTSVLEAPVPSPIVEMTDVRHLLVMASQVREQVPSKLQRFSCALLKIMHVIAHVDRDLRNYLFPKVRDQVHERFRNAIVEGAFQLPDGNKIPLELFQIKEQKPRKSIIMKLLFKPEMASEEVFDRLGIRFVVKDVALAFPLIKGLVQTGLVGIPNLRPSRSRNYLVDLKKYKAEVLAASNDVRTGLLSDEDFYRSLSEKVARDIEGASRENPHSSDKYRAIQFTTRQLVRIENAAFTKLHRLRNLAKETQAAPELMQELQKIDLAQIPREYKFFYPVEIQIMDKGGFEDALHGEASHSAYKQQQLNVVRKRLLGDLA